MSDEAININVKAEDALSGSLEAIRIAQEMAWDHAFREVRSIPHWYSPEARVGGFDLGTEGEEGAYEAVMEVLKNNPYRSAE